MSPSLLLSRPARILSRFALFSAVLAGGVSSARAQLLFEHERGGLDRYIGIGGPVALSFTLTEATRIQGITGWMASVGDNSISVAGDNPDHDFFTKEFIGSSTPELSRRWQGIGGLKLDLQPGEYHVVFNDGYFPIAYGGPASTAPNSFNWTLHYNDSDDTWEELGFPIGARIYGAPLSAVPEPASYGAAAGLLLVGLTVLHRRMARRTLRSAPAI